MLLPPSGRQPPGREKKQSKMAKEGVITTSGLNCYGSRVLTDGGDLTQYEKNPVLLYMHCRAYDGKTMPIGRIENLRKDGDQLIGTPVFDDKDEFAKRVGQKWEDGFLRMFSAGIEILETSVEPTLLLAGQTRPTVTKWKLNEVSIVDIGGNDAALQLMHGGKILELASGKDNDVLPLLELKNDNASSQEPGASINNQKTNRMKKETLDLLGLSETATEQEIHDSIKLLKEKAGKVDQLELSSVTSAVDAAVKEKRITESQREHFVNLGKKLGVEDLRKTLELLKPAVKPTEVIDTQHDAPAGGQSQRATFTKLSDVPAGELEKLRKEHPTEYMRLYKEEYGVECHI